VHKAGGTSLCALARRNGEQTTDTNCNLEYETYGFLCNKAKAAAMSANAQRAYLSMLPVTFGANECIAPTNLPGGLVYMTSLREPLERAASHFFYEQTVPDRTVPWAGQDDASFEDFVLKSMGSDDYTSYYWDNYMTRFFSGTTHTDAIGYKELARARAKLASLDVLFDLDHLDASMEQLASFLPDWHDITLPKLNAAEREAGTGVTDPRTVELSPAAHEKLMSANTLDAKLYEQFRSVVARRAASLATHDLALRSLHSVVGNTSVGALPRHDLERLWFGDSLRIVVRNQTSSNSSSVRA